MTKQSNELVALEWLIDPLNKELDVLHAYNTTSDSDLLLHFAHEYRSMANVLLMANLTEFTKLARAISEAAGYFATLENAKFLTPKILYASRLLQHEINRYATTGFMRRAMLNARTRYLNLVHAHVGGGADKQSILQSAIDERFSEQIDLSVAGLIPLDDNSYQEINQAWKVLAAQLIQSGTNGEQLIKLRNVSTHLASATDEPTLQKLWLLTALWLENLALNNEPLPQYYAHLLSELDRVIAVQRMNMTLGLEANIWLESLISDMYVMLSGIKHVNDDAQNLFKRLNDALVDNQAFFPHILSIIEGLIFALADNKIELDTLHVLREQLSARGWSFYARYIEQIITDAQIAQESDEMFAQMQWQINTQLQDLYTAISSTAEVINAKDGQEDAIAPVGERDVLREVRILVEEIKDKFAIYLQSARVDDLPATKSFELLDKNLNDMGLLDVATVITKMSQVFSALQVHAPAYVRWQLAHKIAESLSLFEMFFDNLAGQVFDHALLVRAEECTDEAILMLDEAIETGEQVSNAEHERQLSHQYTVLYDDTGEHLPTAQMALQAVPSIMEVQQPIQVVSNQEQSKLSAIHDMTDVADGIDDEINFENTKMDVTEHGAPESIRDELLADDFVIEFDEQAVQDIEVDIDVHAYQSMVDVQLDMSSQHEGEASLSIDNVLSDAQGGSETWIVDEDSSEELTMQEDELVVDDIVIDDTMDETISLDNQADEIEVSMDKLVFESDSVIDMAFEELEVDSEAILETTTNADMALEVDPSVHLDNNHISLNESQEFHVEVHDNVVIHDVASQEDDGFIFDDELTLPSHHVSTQSETAQEVYHTQDAEEMLEVSNPLNIPEADEVQNDDVNDLFDDTLVFDDGFGIDDVKMGKSEVSSLMSDDVAEHDRSVVNLEDDYLLFDEALDLAVTGQSSMHDDEYSDSNFSHNIIEDELDVEVTSIDANADEQVFDDDTRIELVGDDIGLNFVEEEGSDILSVDVAETSNSEPSSDALYWSETDDEILLSDYVDEGTVDNVVPSSTSSEISLDLPSVDETQVVVNIADDVDGVILDESVSVEIYESDEEDVNEPAHRDDLDMDVLEDSVIFDDELQTEQNVIETELFAPTVNEEIIVDDDILIGEDDNILIGEDEEIENQQVQTDDVAETIMIGEDDDDSILIDENDDDRILIGEDDEEIWIGEDEDKDSILIGEDEDEDLQEDENAHVPQLAHDNTEDEQDESLSQANEEAVEKVFADDETESDLDALGLSEVYLAAKESLKEDDFSHDEEFREIFIEEADEVMEEMQGYLPKWQANPQNLKPLKEIRRNWHTLKGSGRMVGAFQVGETAWAIENMLNRVLDETIKVSPDVVAIVGETAEIIPVMVQDFAKSEPPSVDNALVVMRANNILAGRPMDEGAPTVSAMADVVDDLAQEATLKTALVGEDINVDHDALMADSLANQVVESQQEQTADVVETIMIGEDDDDDSILIGENDDDRILIGGEDEEILIGEDEDDDRILIGEDEDGDHILIGEDGDDDCHESTIASTQDIEQASSKETYELATEKSGLPAVLLPFIETANATVHAPLEVDEDIREIYIEEAAEVLEAIIPLFDKYQVSPNKAVLTDVRRGFHTLKGSGRMVGAYELGELAWSIENMLNRVLDETVPMDAGMQALISDVLSEFNALVAIFEAKSDDYPTKIKLWEAVAHAYSKGHGKDFDYRSLSEMVDVSEVISEQDSTEELTTSDEAAQIDVVADVLNDEAVPDESVVPTKNVVQSGDHVKPAHDALSLVEQAGQLMSNATPSSPADDEENMLCQIFIEEAQELLTEVTAFLDKHDDDNEVPVDNNVVRAFHTLRGASGLAPLTSVGEVGAIIERGLQSLQHHDAPMGNKHKQALRDAVALIQTHLNAYNSSQEESINQATLSEFDEDKQEIEELMADEGEIYQVEQLIEGIDDLLDAELELEDISTQAEVAIADYAKTQLAQIELLSSRTHDLPKFQSLLAAIKPAYELMAEHTEQAKDDSFIDALLMAHHQLIGLFDAIAGSMALTVDKAVLNRLNAITLERENYYLELGNTLKEQSKHAEMQEQDVTPVRLEIISTDDELLEIFLDEALELDTEVSSVFGQWREDKDNLTHLKTLQRHLHTIKGGARLAGISSIGDLTHEAESVYERFTNKQMAVTDAWVRTMQRVQDVLSLQLEAVKNTKQSFFADNTIADLQAYLAAGEVPEGAVVAIPVLEGKKQQASSVQEPEPVVEEVDEEERYQSFINESWQGNQPDKDILAVFLEEAKELAESSSEDFAAFRNNTSDVASLQSLQRKLHTIKGGARMVSANGVADLAHEMETVYEDLGNRRLPATRMVSNLLFACHDWISAAVGLLEHNYNPPRPTPLIDTLHRFIKSPDSLSEVPTVSLEKETNFINEYQAFLASSSNTRDISRMPPMKGVFGESVDSSSNNEMIRISAPLLERMINLSGEAAINRARIDMNLASITGSIEEMGVTVQRLFDQLRRMDIELEEQILSQIDDGTFDEGFDPLEMDQYSSLNQLSKSLSESASDLLDIKATMLEKTRDGENLLLQLSRTQTDLQDSLMNSRMVPFSRLTPRLQRIVRQTASELGKNVDLTVVNADDEMDRSILDRITSPLEHMLRNAVDHGVEMPTKRSELGKPMMGHITLEVLREGGEMVILLSDDGAGVNVEAVRNKAISQGLIRPDEQLSDSDIMQYIFNAGLSTTNKVTQISGRGVGMDVVRTEIRQLGGSVSVESEFGKGSRFIIRVPLTVAMSDALIVRVADRQYAIPLVQIERVVQMNASELLAYHQSGDSTMKIQNKNYRLRYLNEILTGNYFNEIVSGASLPVIIIKTQTGQALALQVDEIVGSRIEIVVKPLGRQLSNLSGISAATIMGDGSVMLILDLLALMRTPQTRREVKEIETTISRRRLIMVVDDSVTVRKVTSRFLERQGFEVIVAKDGVDAIEILQDTMPDLMLLDIEMPRMDGFEVATQVRHSPRLTHLPIIMITSRTGEKHREHAFEIGVNDYMGKPFQEMELLERIGKLIDVQK